MVLDCHASVLVIVVDTSVVHRVPAARCDDPVHVTVITKAGYNCLVVYLGVRTFAISQFIGLIVTAYEQISRPGLIKVNRINSTHLVELSVPPD